jgi:hypothetical protein
MPRNFYKTFFFLVTTILCIHGLYAQKTIVSGTVIDVKTKEPMPFVNIIFKNTKSGTTTDIDGKYRIETYYASDSLTASFIGYKSSTKKAHQDQTQVINFELSTGGVEIGEVVVTYSGNPAHKILDRVIDNKAINNREKYDAYEYEVYNKVEFDLNNISDEFKDRRVFNSLQFIFDYIDSTTSDKQYLPMFMTESLSDYYYRRDPKSEREVIKGTKVSGVSNESISQFLGDMYQNVNVYENHIGVFGKSFVSPIADFGKRFYKYYLIDSMVVDGNFCYQIEFVPKQAQEPVFSGTMWINDTTYAIKRIEAGINEKANINFINGFTVEQRYKKVNDEFWMLSKDNLIVDFTITKNSMGLYGRKTTTYKDFVMNKPRPDETFDGVEKVVVQKGANEKGDEFWDKNRHDTLSENEKNIYLMVDSVKNVPAFRTFIDVIQLAFTGYKEVGLFEIGPYFNAYSFNKVEGHRFRVGGRTSNNFSTQVMIDGYLAYGLKDERFKYGGGVLYFLSKEPRHSVSVNYSLDVEQLGLSQNAFSEDNILSSVLRRNPNDKLTGVEEIKVGSERFWFNGFSNTLTVTNRTMRPLGSIQYNQKLDNGTIVPVGSIRTTEIGLKTRFAYQEAFVAGEFDRISLGTEFPIVELNMGFGIKGIFGSDYDYTKVALSVSDNIKLGTFGKTEVKAQAGKYFGTLPFTLLEIHNGNETYFFDNAAFNLMNFFEFISDEYVSLMVTHHFEGFFLNKIPLMRRLKWREVVTGRAVVGSLEDKNKQTLELPRNMYELTGPYAEAAVGIENIFKIIRVDALWRLTYLDHPDIAKFGIRATFEIQF